MKALMLLLLLVSSSVQAGKLTQYEEGVLVGTASMAYNLGLLTTGTPAVEPYICQPFPVEWNEFYLVLEDNYTQQLEALPVRERRALGSLVKYRAWQAVIQEYGCGGWYTTLTIPR